MTKPSRRWLYLTEHFSRWQFNSPTGMMRAIVERPAFEFSPRGLLRFASGALVHLPVGWTWRTYWVGPPQGWRPTLRGAQLQAEKRVAEINIFEADREKFRAQAGLVEED